jgi:hypothetical protein
MTPDLNVLFLKKERIQKYPSYNEGVCGTVCGTELF